MINDTQKEIYNLYLRALRVNNGKPFRRKKKFDDINNPSILLYLQKLESFFKKFPHMLRNEFFDAPYVIYKDEKKYYDLRFFSSTKGLSTCIAYFKLLNDTNPDNQMDYIKSSLKFIVEFCIEKGIQFCEYSDYKTVVQPDCLKHIKEHRISWYVVFSIDSLKQKVYSMSNDEFELYFGSDISISQMYSRYTSSQVALPFLKKKIPEMAKYVTKCLKKRESSGK